MFQESRPGMSSEHSDDIEKFVAGQEGDLKDKLEIDPLTNEKIDAAQKKAGEREERGH